MHQIRFPLGSAPDPAGGAYCAPPDPLAVFEGPILLRGGRGRKEEGRGKEGRLAPVGESGSASARPSPDC